MNDQTSTPEPTGLEDMEAILTDVLSSLGVEMDILVPDGNGVDGQVLAITHMAGAATGIITLMYTNLIPRANQDTAPYVAQTWARGFHEGACAATRTEITPTTEAGLYSRLLSVARDYFGHVAETPRARAVCALTDAALYAGMADAIESSDVVEIAEHHSHGGVTAAQAHYRSTHSALAGAVALNLLDEPE